MTNDTYTTSHTLSAEGAAARDKRPTRKIVIIDDEHRGLSIQTTGAKCFLEAQNDVIIFSMGEASVTVTGLISSNAR